MHRKIKFEQLTHPTHSLDLDPSDFYMFGPMKVALRGQHFDGDDEAKKVVHSRLKSQLKKIYSDDINKLVTRWTKCIAVGGNYVEK